MKSPSVTFFDTAGNPINASTYGESNATMAGWQPQAKTMDAALLPGLALGNARAEDVIKNNAFASNAVNLHVDNIVGHMFRLSYKPNFKRLGIKENEALAFAREVEAVWAEISDDPNCYLDVERKRTFTMMVREAVGTHTRLGEAMAVPHWINRSDSLLRTCIKTLSPNRVSNPHGRADTSRLKGGISQDKYGAAQSYHVRSVQDGFMGTGMGNRWDEIPKLTRHGRPRFIHIFEPTADGQTRGANQFVTVLEQLQMMPKMQKTKLENAVVNSMYAATIESEMGPEAAFDLLGGEANSKDLQNMLGRVADYHQGVSLKLGGASVPHLLPNEKLNLHTSGNVDNGYVDLESSVLRWLSAGLSVPYEQLARDYRQSSYSSARASMLEGWRHFMGRRKIIASRFATMVFRLAFEEIIHRKLVTLPRGATLDIYQGLGAWTNCDWIGTGRLAIDGLKEVKEAVLRIESGLSTYEKELANMGEDYQEVFAQQVREQEERREAGLPSASWIKAEVLAPSDQTIEAA